MQDRSHLAKGATADREARPRRRIFAAVKERRAVATHYEKTAVSFMGILYLAAALDWIKS